MGENLPLWKKVYAWWKKLPWWGKALGCIALLGVALIFVASLIRPSGGVTPPIGGGGLTPADKTQDNNLGGAVTTYTENKEKLERDLKNKKLIEISMINQSGKLTKKNLEAREKINNAKSIEEIDEILRGAK